MGPQGTLSENTATNTARPSQEAVAVPEIGHYGSTRRWDSRSDSGQ